MAAHTITALNQLQEDIDQNRVNWDHLRAALNFSCWTEDLSLDDYLDLDVVVSEKDHNGLAAWIEEVYPRYLQTWYSLGEPRDRESWNEARFGAVKKN